MEHLESLQIFGILRIFDPARTWSYWEKHAKIKHKVLFLND